jgi:hypothetical protein
MSANANDSEAPLGRLVDLLTAAGYRAQISEGSVVSSSAGMPFAIRWYADHSVQLAGGARNVPPAFDLHAVNDYNGQYRFGTLYKRGDDLILQASFMLELDEPNAGDRVERILGIFESLVSRLRDQIDALADDAEPDPGS